MNTSPLQNHPAEALFPYKPWWGLLGCAAFMGLIIFMGPYSANISFTPDSILGAPKLTMIMYAGTLMTALTFWVLLRVARLMGMVLRA
jgi:hypothetical protein